MRDIKKEIEDIKIKIKTIQSDPEIWYEYPYIKDNYYKDRCIRKYGKCIFDLLREEEQLFKDLNLSRINKLLKDENKNL